jgi:hypothetical protein
VGRAMSALHPLIGSRILTLREQRVTLDADLAELYGVETRVLVQAVKRNQGMGSRDGVRSPISYHLGRSKS